MQRSRERFALLLVVVMLCFAVPAAHLTAVAEDQTISELLDEGAKHPSLGPPADDPNLSRGHSTELEGEVDGYEEAEGPEQSGYQRVFPPDDRLRISPTMHYPARAVVMLERLVGGTRVDTCTGTFIGPDVVLTAGHCLYTHNTGWGEAVRVIPGRDGSQEPFGSQFALNSWVPDEWFLSMNPEWDWGLVRLPDSALDDTVGWFQIGVLTTESLMTPDFQPALAGYPGDKPYGTMWLSTVPSFTEVSPFFLTNQIDSTPGQSGAAVWRGSDAVIVGIQAFELEHTNVASRIDMELLADLLDGCAALDCLFSYFVEHDQPPTDSGPAPPPAESFEPQFASGEAAGQVGQAFTMTRDRTDQPITAGQVDRTWMWGPEPNSALSVESYESAPGGTRVVRYYDKSRMEDNAYRAGPPWHVTNGLLVLELITGRMHVSDSSVIQRVPAHVQVAGDDHPDSPTYAMLDSLRSWDPLQPGAPITQRLEADGAVTADESLANRGVTAGYYVSDTHHTVASVFWQFMNSSGIV